MVPNFASALKNLGNLYKEIGEFDKASEYLQKAVDAENSANSRQKSVDALWNQATLCYYKGVLKRGGLSMRQVLRMEPELLLTMAILHGRVKIVDNQSILVIGEQGIGDEIMFASCFDDAIRQFKQVTIECDSRLVPLFQRSFEQATIVGRDEHNKLYNNDKINCQIPAGSLPNYFRRHKDAFPKSQQFFQADPDKIQTWQKRLSALGNQLKIGIAWRGGKTPMIIQKRSTSLSLWQSILQRTNAQFINLQYGECQQDIDWVQKELGIQIQDFDDINPLAEMDNYAALVASLDLVISIDNSVVHLAGALGQKTWVLMPYIADWRWQMDTQTSVWYPSLQLFRQTERDNWEPLFSAVETNLGKFTKISSSINRETSSTKRALLMNDTSSWYHWGCTCTSSALLTQLTDMGYTYG